MKTVGCTHVRQTPIFSVICGVAEFTVGTVLPCAVPECHEASGGKDIDVEVPVPSGQNNRKRYQRVVMEGAWRWMAMSALSLLLAVSTAACGDNTEPEAQESAATTLPDCPDDGIELYFYGCASSPTVHVCTDARGVQHASGCVIHDAEGTLTATCVAVCP